MYVKGVLYMVTTTEGNNCPLTKSIGNFKHKMFNFNLPEPHYFSTIFFTILFILENGSYLHA